MSQRPIGRFLAGALAGVLATTLAPVPGPPAARGGGPEKVAPNNLVYEVFVRSFFSAGPDRRGRDGNLRGLIAKLDYLNDGDPKTTSDLGVGILWLMPVFPSPSYHGYDVTDYRAIHPDYGTMKDFEDLIRAARDRRVRVLLDIPFNHTSDDHPWFREAIRDKDSPFRPFYHIEPDDGPRPGGWHPVTEPSGARLRYFGLFSSKMPDLNFDNPGVRRQVKNIAKFWLDKGVAGFRLDAAKHIYADRFDQPREVEILKNNDWWLEFSRSVYAQNPDAVLVGEVLGDPKILRRHAFGLEGLLNEPFMNALRAQVSGPQPGFLGRYKQFLTASRELHRRAFPGRTFQPFDYVASHDRNPRFKSDLEEMRHRGMTHGEDAAYRTALHALLTISSRPILYQGDEVKQRGFRWNGNSPKDPNNPGDGSGIFDEPLREPFPWYRGQKGKGEPTWFAPRFDRPDDGVSVEEEDRAGEMLDLVRGLSRLRARHPALANGDLGEIPSDTQDWMVFEKVAGDDHYLVLINLTGKDSDYRFHPAWLPQYIGSRVVFTSEGDRRRWRDTTDEGISIRDTATVPAFGLTVLRRPQRATE